MDKKRKRKELQKPTKVNRKKISFSRKVNKKNAYIFILHRVLVSTLRAEFVGDILGHKKLNNQNTGSFVDLGRIIFL